MKKKLILFLLICFPVLWYLSIPKEQEFVLPIFTPSDLRSNLVHPSLVGKKEHIVPNFSFIDQNGNIVSEKTVENKIYIVDFFFTSCPSICIDLTNNIKEVQSVFEENDDVLILSHSVDPKVDNIERLQKYASINNISLEEVEKIFENSQYGEFKIAVGEAVSNYFAPIYSNFQELENEDISKVLDSNLKEAQISAEETINEVNNILGL